MSQAARRGSGSSDQFAEHEPTGHSDASPAHRPSGPRARDAGTSALSRSVVERPSGTQRRAPGPPYVLPRTCQPAPLETSPLAITTQARDGTIRSRRTTSGATSASEGFDSAVERAIHEHRRVVIPERAQQPDEQPHVHQRPVAVEGAVVNQPRVRDIARELHRARVREQRLSGQLREPPILRQLGEVPLRLAVPALLPEPFRVASGQTEQRFHSLHVGLFQHLALGEQAAPLQQRTQCAGLTHRRADQHAEIGLNGAAPESNRPSVGLPHRTVFEVLDRRDLDARRMLGHARGAASLPHDAQQCTGGRTSPRGSASRFLLLTRPLG